MFFFSFLVLICFPPCFMSSIEWKQREICNFLPPFFFSTKTLKDSPMFWCNQRSHFHHVHKLYGSSFYWIWSWEFHHLPVALPLRERGRDIYRTEINIVWSKVCFCKSSWFFIIVLKSCSTFFQGCCFRLNKNQSFHMFWWWAKLLISHMAVCLICIILSNFKVLVTSHTYMCLGW